MRASAWRHGTASASASFSASWPRRIASSSLPAPLRMWACAPTKRSRVSGAASAGRRATASSISVRGAADVAGLLGQPGAHQQRRGAGRAASVLAASRRVDAARHAPRRPSSSGTLASSQPCTVRASSCRPASVRAVAQQVGQFGRRLPRLGAPGALEREHALRRCRPARSPPLSHCRRRARSPGPPPPATRASARDRGRALVFGRCEGHPIRHISAKPAARLETLGAGRLRVLARAAVHATSAGQALPSAVPLHRRHRHEQARPPAPLPRPGPRLYWEDFPAGQVREFGALTVRREDIVDFARAATTRSPSTSTKRPPATRRSAGWSPAAGTPVRWRCG